MRAHHDMGGLPAGPIERSEHTYAPWEKRTHAMMILLAERPGLLSVDQLRRGIEALGEGEYDRRTYYERWIASIADNLIQKGIITVDELGRKLAEIEAREKQPS
jgi:hypothetical protein